MKKNHRAWFVLAGCCVVTFLGMGLGMHTVGLYFPSISAEFDAGIAQVSAMMAFTALGIFIGMPIMGIIMPKMNLRILMTICVSLMAGGQLFNSFAIVLPMLYIGNIMIGLAWTLLPGILNAVVLGNWFSKRLGFALGVVTCISAFGGALLNPIFSVLITNLGWRMSYRISALLIVAIMLPVVWIFIRFAPKDGETPYGAEEADVIAAKADAQPKTMEGFTFKQAIRSGVFYVLFFSGAVMALQGGMAQQISMHVTTSVGLPLTVAATIMSGFLIGSATGNLTLGILLDMKPVRSLIIFMLAGVLGWLGLAYMQTQILLIMSGFLMGTAQSTLIVGQDYIARRVFGGREFSRISAVQNMILGVVPALSIIGVGAIYDATGSFTIPFTLGAVVVPVSICLLIAGYKISVKMKAANETVVAEEETQ